MRSLAWMVLSFVVLALPSGAFAQGSIFGTVQNQNLSSPAVGELYWIGFLNDSDEEVRIELNTGAGYDGVNWFDDFQNYSTESPGNPFDYHFVNVVNGQSFHLFGPIPSGSFQQENILLAPSSFPAQPTNVTAQAVSTSQINVSWNAESGVTYHVYRRNTANNGVYLRVDDPTGSLANPGVANSYFVDNTSDGVSDYTYIVMGEDIAGNYSAHSVPVSVLASALAAPTVVAVVPDSGSASQMPLVTVQGTNFDLAGASVTFGGSQATNVVVNTPLELTCNVPIGSPGSSVPVTVTNSSSGLPSSALVDGFRYIVIDAQPPAIDPIGPQVVSEGGHLEFHVGATDLDGTYDYTYIVMGEDAFGNYSAHSGEVAILASPPIGESANEVQQGSIFGTVQNSNLTVPADGELFWMGFLNNTDDEIRVESNTGAGYAGGNWFDDFQNYSNEAAGQPYDYVFVNSTSGEAFRLENLVPSNSFQEENIILAPAGAPARPAGLLASIDARNRAVISWDPQPGVSFHVYRRGTPNNGVFLRLDDSTGNLANAGVPTSSFVDYYVNLGADSIPLNASFADSGNGGGVFTFDPDFSQAGVYSVTIIASDGTLADTEIVSITVTESNVAPILAPIGPQTVDETQTLTVPVSASDFDGDSIILSALNLPLNATFVDSGNGAGSLDFTPDFTQAGVYNVTFIASDGVLADSEVVAITVNDVNAAPALAPIGPQVVDEGQVLNLAVTATDAQGDSIILTALNVPLNSTFTDNADGTGLFNFSPDFTQSGTYPVTFIASDGLLADTEIVTITVNESGNQGPVLAPIGAQIVDEGQPLLILATASDPDSSIPFMSVVGTPAAAVFTDSLNGIASLEWTPTFFDSGSYQVLFIATDSLLADSEMVTITVNDIDRPPILTPIGPQSVLEGDSLILLIAASDADSHVIALTTDTLPANATFFDSSSGVGEFVFAPDFTQSGVHTVGFIAQANGLADTEFVAITVVEFGNHFPVIDSIGPKVVNEFDTLTFRWTASDLDGVIPVLTVVNPPLNATHFDSANGAASFSFAPDFTQVGDHIVSFIASDGLLADTELVTITVTELGNFPPEFDPVDSATVSEGDTLTLVLRATDPEGDSVDIGITQLIPNSSFVDSGNGVAVFTFTPDFLQSGFDTITVIAVDQAIPPASSVLIIPITTYEVNQAPILDSLGRQVVLANDSLKLRITASDTTSPSGSQQLFFTALNIPPNSEFADSGNGVAGFIFRPTFAQIDTFTVTFIVTDDGTPSLADQEVVDIEVRVTNRPPVLNFIGPQIVTEGGSLTFGVSATDPDGTIPALRADSLPINATFFDSGNGAGSCTFNPEFTQGGLHEVIIIADDGVDEDREQVLIQVLEAGNQVPIITPIGPQQVIELSTLTIVMIAADPDSTIPALSVDTLIENATFVDSGNGIGVYTITPDFFQDSVYLIRFVAADSVSADTENVFMTIVDIGNQTPVLDPIPAQTPKLEESGNDFIITVSASDLDLTTPILEVSLLPDSAQFADNGDGTGIFYWPPSFDAEGTYAIVFRAIDAENPAIYDSQIVTMEVLDNNRPPIISSITGGLPQVAQNDSAIFTITTFDQDGDIPRLDISNPIPNVTFVTDNGDGTAELLFAPVFSTVPQVYFLNWVVTDGRYDTVTVTQSQGVQVIAINLPPEIDTVGLSPQTVLEGDSLSFTVTATDPNGFEPNMAVLGALPPGATFTPSPGSALFAWRPTFLQSGNYVVQFTASDGPNFDTALVLITVQEAGNQPPEFVVAPPATDTVVYQTTLQRYLYVTDLDHANPLITAENLPLNATLFDSGTGGATFTFTPDSIQIDSLYTVRFIVSDGIAADTAISSYAVIWFIRGDVNFDGAINVLDVTYLIDYVFRFGPDPLPVVASGDVNADGSVNVLDVTYLIEYVFRFGPPPPP